MTRTAPSLAVVIPTLDEATTLPLLLTDLRRLALLREVVVADGDSRDGTVALARALGARVVRGPAGRSDQIRAGVESTTAPWILILHSDCRFTPECAEALEEWLGRATATDSAHFRFALQGRDPFWRFLELGQSLRERLWGLVYGDQGLLLSRATWEAVGGVPRLPLMEDVALVDLVRRQGRLHRLEASLPTSPRRYVRGGRVSGWLRNLMLVALYRMGIPPGRLAPLYPKRVAPGVRAPVEGRNGGTSGGKMGASNLVIFARAPREGEVKTRLAAGVGPEAAIRLYRRMGRDVMDALRAGPWNLTVAYTPGDGGDEVRSWLSGADRYVAQGAGDLGARMRRALDEALRGTGKAVVVGTDAPDLDRALVVEAVRSLDDHDVVLVPALDGGYVLLGLRAMQPELFHDVPWSTEQVLGITLERANRLGLRVRLLPAVPDVDTAADLPDRYRNGVELRPSRP